MTPTDKHKFKAQVQVLAAQLQGAKSMLSMPIPPTPPMPQMVPIPLAPSLTPLQNALKMQSDVIDKLVKLLGDVIEAA
jgi:hypothetical protein